MTNGGMTIAMVGDLLIQHRLSPYGGDGRFEDFLRVLRDADVGIGNLECAVYDGDDSPAFVAGGSRGGGVDGRTAGEPGGDPVDGDRGGVGGEQPQCRSWRGRGCHDAGTTSTKPASVTRAPAGA